MHVRGSCLRHIWVKVEPALSSCDSRSEMLRPGWRSAGGPDADTVLGGTAARGRLGGRARDCSGGAGAGGARRSRAGPGRGPLGASVAAGGTHRGPREAPQGAESPTTADQRGPQEGAARPLHQDASGRGRGSRAPSRCDDRDEAQGRGPSESASREEAKEEGCAAQEGHTKSRGEEDRDTQEKEESFCRLELAQSSRVTGGVIDWSPRAVPHRIQRLQRTAKPSQSARAKAPPHTRDALRGQCFSCVVRVQRALDGPGLEANPPFPLLSAQAVRVGGQ